MPKNEQTAPKIATLAAKVLAGDIKPTPAPIRSLAGAVLTQTPDRTHQMVLARAVGRQNQK